MLKVEGLGLAIAVMWERDGKSKRGEQDLWNAASMLLETFGASGEPMVMVLS